MLDGKKEAASSKRSSRFSLRPENLVKPEIHCRLPAKIKKKNKRAVAKSLRDCLAREKKKRFAIAIFKQCVRTNRLLNSGRGALDVHSYLFARLRARLDPLKVSCVCHHSQMLDVLIGHVFCL